jgi:hypothetical protein
MFALVHIEECLSFDIINEACAFFEEIFNNDLEEISDVAVEVVLDFGLGSEWGVEYLPGRCFCSRNHLLPYSSYLA